MPAVSKKRAQSRSAIAQRWPQPVIVPVESEEETKEDFRMDFDDEVYADQESGIIEKEDFSEVFDLNDIGDLLELCVQTTNIKNISLLLYMTLRYFKISWRVMDFFFQEIGAARCSTSHKWADIFLSGDIGEFNSDFRGGKMTDSFYDIFPDIENEAKAFAISECQKKTSDFKASDLRGYIDGKFYEATGLTKDGNDSFIRSERTCRIDLKNWGAVFEKNSARPYFLGHERPDVVNHRNTFVSYVLSRKNHYYTLTDDELPSWISPTEHPCVLLCHDESTFRSGEVSAKRWMMNENTGFFSKGKGRSYMVSDFLVQHPSGPFFYLNDDEWNEAITKYPSLDQIDDVDYVSKSATASINIGSDCYFDNNTVLSQFERIFQMLKFKRSYRNHNIEIIVDNARTHSAKRYSLNDFGKSIGTRCPVETISYYDENRNEKTIDCRFRSGPNKGKTKGLFVIAIELGISVASDCKLPDLINILSRHKAFQNTSKLEELGVKYNIKIIFAPKYHCEVNPIEGLWCHQKQFVRSRTDQTFNTMIRLIAQSRINFVEKNIHQKLFRRFWRCLQAYQSGKSYADVLQLFFSHLCKGDVSSHRKITNTNLD